MSWFKKQLLRWLLKDIKCTPIKDNVISKNMFGIAGNSVIHMSFTEDQLFKSLYNKSHKVSQCQKPEAVREKIFYELGYFEQWCEQMCSGRFGMIHIGNLYIFIFREEEDAVLFRLAHVEGNSLIK